MARRPKPSGRGRGYAERRVNTREIRQRFLIVCEGEKTEPNYFRKFKAPGLVVEIQGLGRSSLQLVEEAHARSRQDEYDQVWCVFDRDAWSIDNFNGALDKARAHGVQVAYTNEAFELWYLLHFDYHDTAMARAEYGDRLTAHLGRPYAKNSLEIFATLWPRLDDALRNAARLLAQYDPPKPAVDNPSTTVHLLVSELRRFSR